MTAARGLGEKQVRNNNTVSRGTPDLAAPWAPPSRGQESSYPCGQMEPGVGYGDKLERLLFTQRLPIKAAWPLHLELLSDVVLRALS